MRNLYRIKNECFFLVGKVRASQKPFFGDSLSLFLVVLGAILLYVAYPVQAAPQKTNMLKGEVGYNTLSSQQTAVANFIISNNRFHIGDAHFAQQSSAANTFSEPSSGPQITLNFQLPGKNVGTPLPYVLVFNHVLGLDTVAAHLAGQSIANSNSSPALVYLNGQLIGQLQRNGNRIGVPVVPGLLKWQQNNQLTVQGGVRLEKSTRQDVDDFEWQGLFLQQVGP